MSSSDALQRGSADVSNLVPGGPTNSSFVTAFGTPFTAPGSLHEALTSRPDGEPGVAEEKVSAKVEENCGLAIATPPAPAASGMASSQPKSTRMRRTYQLRPVPFRTPHESEGPRDIRGEARAARGPALPARARRLRGRGRQAARAGQDDRPRAGREAARPRLLQGARHLRAAPHLRVRHGQEAALGRRGGHRSRHHRRPHGVRVQPGLHRVRRLARRGDGGEDVQDHGPGGQDRLPRDRHQRLGRRPHPGGRRVARRLRRRVRAQRRLLRRDPADQRHHGPLRGRRGLLARDDGLHLHGEGDVAHVHHGPRRDQDRHRRGADLRGARRGDDAQHEVGRRALRRRERGGVPRGRALPDELPAAQQPGEAAPVRPRRRSRADGPRARQRRAGGSAEALRHARRVLVRRRRRRLLRGPPRTGRRTS